MKEKVEMNFTEPDDIHTDSFLMKLNYKEVNFWTFYFFFIITSNWFCVLSRTRSLCIVYGIPITILTLLLQLHEYKSFI